MSHEVSLEGMPPIKKPRKKVVKKHHTTKNVPVEVSIRRQLSEEIGEDELTKDQKFALLQKYGVTAPRIDRLAIKPNWMGVAEWKRKQNDWFKMTKGLVSPQQRPKSYQPKLNSRSPQEFRATARAHTPNVSLNQTHPNTRNQQSRRPDTKTYPRNYGPAKTENRPR